MKFCDHLPPNCPPSEATSLVIEVYCLVDSDPPTDNDFLSLKERKPEKVFADPVMVCQACGLSVFTDLTGLELARRVSRGLRKKKVAKGYLSKNSGKIKNTPSQKTGNTHHTWWPARNIEPCALFNVVPQSL
jgi:hypothetical protein